MTQFNLQPKVTAKAIAVILIQCVCVCVRVGGGAVSESRPHLAALTGMDAVVEARGHVAAHLTQQHQAVDF